MFRRLRRCFWASRRACSASGDPTYYVLPQDDQWAPEKLESIFKELDTPLFVGHTHIPGVFTAAGEFWSPDSEGKFALPVGEKIIANVGSVGQPRDSDPRACFAVLEGNELEFHRVEYPLEPVIEQIYDIPQLDNFLGDRLREGR